MITLSFRNVHQSLPLAIDYLRREGVRRASRNGPVLVAPQPVTTLYTHSNERVIFYPERDANPFFHLYEALWMLAGRNDAAGVSRYASNMKNFSDDGITLHGAYGYRWRHGGHAHSILQEVDQLSIIAYRLKENPDDRRCVLQMWNTDDDLGGTGKDYPCNTIATFQRDSEGKLDLVVFCRSNDLIWGTAGANAVHFSMLLEYMANWIGCPIGKYYQISVNYHAYLSTFEPLQDLSVFDPSPYTMGKIETTTYGSEARTYVGRDRVVPTPLPLDHDFADAHIKRLLYNADQNYPNQYDLPRDPFIQVCSDMLMAHQIYRNSPAPERYDSAINVLQQRAENRKYDWIVAGTEWMLRRKAAWEKKMNQVLEGDASHL